MITPGVPHPLPDPRDGNIVPALRTAVDEAARPLLQLTSRPGAAELVQIRAAFLAAVAPIRRALDQRLQAEPDSDLAVTMRHLHDAFTHFERGDISSGKTLLVKARAALAKVTHPSDLRREPPV